MREERYLSTTNVPIKATIMLDIATLMTLTQNGAPTA